MRPLTYQLKFWSQILELADLRKEKEAGAPTPTTKRYETPVGEPPDACKIIIVADDRTGMVNYECRGLDGVLRDLDFMDNSFEGGGD